MRSPSTVLLFLGISHLASSFVPSSSISKHPSSSNIQHPYLSPTYLKAEEDTKWAEIQRQEFSDILTRIDTLQDEVQEAEDVEIEVQRKAVVELMSEANVKLNCIMPPSGLTMQDYRASIQTFFNLSPPYRFALLKALGYEEDAALEVAKIPSIVSELYEKRSTLTQKLLVDSLKEVQSTRGEGARRGLSRDNSDAFPEDTKTALEQLLEGVTKGGEMEMEMEMQVKSLLPKVTRKEDQMPSAKDLEVLTAALDSATFSASDRPVEIPGGYVIFGTNRKKSGSLLIEALDAKFPENWDCTVSYMPDITYTSDENNFFEESRNVLVLLKKDFSPIASDWWYRLTSSLAFSTLLLFCIGVYGGNDAVLNQLTDLSSLGDFQGLNWFNGKVGQVLFPILAILASHEFGHFLVSKQQKIQITSFIPTFLPCLGNLPLLGTLTRIQSSPKDRSALFDFAMLGPSFGFLSSFAFFGAGLFATKAALDGDANAAQFLPALPVSVLKLSTLGGSVVDYFFTGGDGYITAQDPNTPIPLHPLAIAGFCGILINGAEMLPLGATDGGRISTALFGRQAHSIIGGFVWLALLVAAFAMEDQQVSILITAWATNNIFQNDIEVPCRDETENPPLSRSLTGFALWFLAALTIIPMGV